MTKKNPPPPPGLLTPAVLSFGVSMLCLGLIFGYMIRGATDEAGDSRPAARAGVKSEKVPPGKVVNNSGGELRLLSDKEKQDLLDKKRDPSPKKAKDTPPADWPYLQDKILGSFSEEDEKERYQAAATFMGIGNARKARSSLLRLHEASMGKPWREPVMALLTDAQASVGKFDEARTLAQAFSNEFSSSAYQVTVVVAKGKASMQEGKRKGNRGKGPLSAGQQTFYRGAIGFFDDAIKIDPSSSLLVDAYLNKASLLSELGELDKAETAALVLADRYATAKNAPRALANVARAAQDSGDFERAKRCHQRLVSAFPNSRLAQSSRSQLNSLELLGQLAPEFELSEWVGESQGTVAELRGKPVMLVFWATWCPHCRREMPNVEKTWQKYKDQGLVVIGITRNSRGQTTDSVKEFMNENGFTVPVAIDPGTTSRAYSVSGIPAAALIDREGKVVFRNHPNQLTEDVIAKVL